MIDTARFYFSSQGARAAALQQSLRFARQCHYSRLNLSYDDEWFLADCGIRVDKPLPPDAELLIFAFRQQREELARSECRA